MHIEQKCKKIRTHVLEFWEQPNSEFTTSQLIAFVNDKLGTNYTMPDTILRMMRFLKEENQLDYICKSRRYMIYQKVHKDVN